MKSHGAKRSFSVVTAKGNNRVKEVNGSSGKHASHSTAKWSPSPDASDIVKNIHAMLHPRNIVLVGATDKPGNYAEPSGIT